MANSLQLGRLVTGCICSGSWSQPPAGGCGIRLVPAVLPHGSTSSSRVLFTCLVDPFHFLECRYVKSWRQISHWRSGITPNTSVPSCAGRRGECDLCPWVVTRCGSQVVVV